MVRVVFRRDVGTGCFAVLEFSLGTSVSFFCWFRCFEVFEGRCSWSWSGGCEFRVGGREEFSV